jgi:hypothetical protein
MAAMLRAVLFASLLGACGADVPAVSIPEMQRGEVEGRPVGVGAISQKPEFRRGKRVMIRRAILYLNDLANNTVQQQDVAEGDEVFIGKDRWTIKEIVMGGPSTRGGVVLQKAEE